MFKKICLSFLALLLGCLFWGCVQATQSPQPTVEETEFSTSAEPTTEPLEEETGTWEGYWENQVGNGYTKRY